MRGAGIDCREVPDVSADADPMTGYIFFYNGSGEHREPVRMAGDRRNERSGTLVGRCVRASRRERLMRRPAGRIC